MAITAQNFTSILASIILPMMNAQSPSLRWIATWESGESFCMYARPWLAVHPFGTRSWPVLAVVVRLVWVFEDAGFLSRLTRCRRSGLKRYFDETTKGIRIIFVFSYQHSVINFDRNSIQLNCFTTSLILNFAPINFCPRKDTGQARKYWPQVKPVPVSGPHQVHLYRLNEAKLSSKPYL